MDIMRIFVDVDAVVVVLVVKKATGKVQKNAIFCDAGVRIVCLLCDVKNKKLRFVARCRYVAR